MSLIERAYSSVESYLQTLNSEYIKPTDETLPPPARRGRGGRRRARGDLGQRIIEVEAQTGDMEADDEMSAVAWTEYSQNLIRVLMDRLSEE